MSAFKTKAKRNKDGEIFEVWCIDGYFSGRNYGYSIINEKYPHHLTEEQFYKQFTPIEEREDGTNS